MLFCAFNFCLIQNENNIWWFGQNAELDFNSGLIVSVTNGVAIYSVNKFNLNCIIAPKK